jgi:drug/metabolite transporter (DMT)-like permease
MKISAAYIAVIVIWSTTPLAIQWSNDGVGFAFGVAARMVIGLGALLLIIKALRLRLPFDRPAFQVYLTGGLPLFCAMSAVYWSAELIPSGWISLLFGLTPLITSLLAQLLLHEKAFTPATTGGMLLGLGGLGVVFAESYSFSTLAWMGVGGVVLAATIHSLGAVLLNRLRPELHPVSITAGSLLIATPLFVANALLQGLPQELPLRSLAAISYLAIMGSALGFPLYFYCLKQLSAQRVALVTLITPVTALLLGAWLNNEVISDRIWIGTGLILLGLAIYQYAAPLAVRIAALRAARQSI